MGDARPAATAPAEPGPQDGAADAGQADARETSHDRLARFASTLFEEEIPAEAVIGEDRLTVEEIVRPDPADLPLPKPADCLPQDFEDASACPRGRLQARGAKLSVGQLVEEQREPVLGRDGNAADAGDPQLHAAKTPLSPPE